MIRNVARLHGASEAKVFVLCAVLPGHLHYICFSLVPKRHNDNRSVVGYLISGASFIINRI